MSTTTQRSLPILIPIAIAEEAALPNQPARTSESFWATRRRHEAARRRRLALAMLLSLVAHLAVFLASRSAPATRVTQPVARSTQEVFQLPVELEEPQEETPDLPPDTQTVELAPPSLPDQMHVAVESDFVQAAAPPIQVSLHSEGSLIHIPQRFGGESVFSGTKVFSLEDLDRRPELVRSVHPLYPPELSSARIHGLVIVHFIVDANGGIVQPELVSAPHPLLGAAVIRCLAQWRFRAGIKAGRAVSTSMELPVRFGPE